MTNADLIDSLIARAKPFYAEALVYHGWHHAEEVMAETGKLIDCMNGEGPHTDRDLMRVAAAWHDAGYSHEQAKDFESKEHYAVWLVKENIGDELNPQDLEMIERAILATRFGVNRALPEEIILHYADLANVGYSYENFFEHTVRLWQEYGQQDWGQYVELSERVIMQTADEAERELPLIGISTSGENSFPLNARTNIEKLKQESVPR